MRFVIYGAGAIGGTIGGRLSQHGHDAVLVARGPHAAAIRDRGLRLVSPDDEATLRLPVVEHPRELTFAGDEVVILAVKSQDTVAALAALGAVAPPEITLVCAQNGVANEREALRRIAHVVAMYVMMPAAHTEPGVVEVSSAPISGVLDVGRYPKGSDERVTAIAAALSAASFESLARPDVMRWKHKKLLTNLGNAVEAACGRIQTEDAHALVELARVEGRGVLTAAGIGVVSDEEEAERRGERLVSRPIGGKPRGGGSSWQSLTRGTGSIEADYLNGEIVLLGRLHGVATPVNAMLQRTANELARDRRPPGTLSARELLGRLR